MAPSTPSAAAAPVEDKGNRFAEGLETSKHKLSAAIGRSLSQLCVEVLRVEPESPNGAVLGCFDIISVTAAQIFSDLSDAHAGAMHDKLKAQATTFEIKLTTQRAASQMEKANLGAELEANFNKKLEDQVSHAMGDSAGALQEAHREAEEAKRELEELKLRFAGVQEALARAQQLHKASEAKMEEAQLDLADAKDYAATLEEQAATLAAEHAQREDRIKAFDKMVKAAHVRSRVHAHPPARNTCLVPRILLTRAPRLVRPTPSLRGSRLMPHALTPSRPAPEHRRRSLPSLRAKPASRWRRTCRAWWRAPPTWQRSCARRG
jgi:hypothetical protein